jgi:2-dehydro-3-deoxygalactonokinase
MEESDFLSEGETLKNFEEGVANSLQHNLLHASFFARTNGLFNRNTKKENYFYLSGLLIGTELKDLMNKDTPISLVCNETQKNYYLTAFGKLGIEGVRFQDAVAATIRGQSNIYNNYNKSLSKS